MVHLLALVNHIGASEKLFNNNYEAVINEERFIKIGIKDHEELSSKSGVIIK